MKGRGRKWTRARRRPRSRSGPGRSSRSRSAAASPTPTSLVDDRGAALRRAGRRRYPGAPASCAATSWPPAARRMPPGSRRRCACRAGRAGARLHRGAHASTPEDVREPGNLDAHRRRCVRRCHREMPQHLRGPAADLLGVPCRARLCRTRCAKPAAATLAAPAGLARAAERARSARSARSSWSSATTIFCRQLHRRRQAAVADRLGLCRLQHAAVRPRRSRLEQRAVARPTGAGCSRPISTGPVDDDLRRRAAAMTARLAAARGHVEHGLGAPSRPLDFDYAAYTAENLARFERGATRPSQTMERA